MEHFVFWASMVLAVLAFSFLFYGRKDPQFQHGKRKQIRECVAIAIYISAVGIMAVLVSYIDSSFTTSWIVNCAISAYLTLMSIVAAAATGWIFAMANKLFKRLLK